MLYMRTIPDKMRTDEVYPAAFGCFVFINIGHSANKRGTRSCAAVSWMWRSASDVCRYLAVRSPSVGTRVAGAQVARVRRHGQEDNLGTWVCEQRVCESEAATNGVREIVVARSSRAGTSAEGYEYLFARVCCICVRYRIRCARMRSILSHLVLL